MVFKLKLWANMGARVSREARRRSLCMTVESAPWDYIELESLGRNGPWVGRREADARYQVNSILVVVPWSLHTSITLLESGRLLGEYRVSCLLCTLTVNVDVTWAGLAPMWPQDTALAGQSNPFESTIVLATALRVPTVHMGSIGHVTFDKEASPQNFSES